eukprot:SAG22_NODE_4318_length_1306_cov_2.320630_2_plen_115_part_00
MAASNELEARLAEAEKLRARQYRDQRAKIVQANASARSKADKRVLVKKAEEMTRQTEQKAKYVEHFDAVIARAEAAKAAKLKELQHRATAELAQEMEVEQRRIQDFQAMTDGKV